RSHPRNLLYSRFVILSMNQKLPIPEPLWNTIPIDAQAALLAAWKAMGDRAVDLHRDDQQAGATVGRGIGGPLQRTGHGGPLGGGDPRRRDLLARGPPQGLAVGGGDRDVYGLHDRPQPQRHDRPGGPGDARRLDRRDRPLEYLRLERCGLPTDLLESSPPRLPGDDRPRRGRRARREKAVAAVGSAAPLVASARGGEGRLGAIPQRDAPAEA